MSCGRYADTLLETALGEPAPPELLDHLRSCAACREALERERGLVGRIDGELRDAVSVSPSPELLPRVRARVADVAASGRPWRLFWLLPVAAGLVAVIASVLLLRQPAPTGSPAIEARGSAAPVAAESPRPVPEAASTRQRPVAPIVPRPRPALVMKEPEVLVPPGEAELIMRFAAALQTRRVDAASLVAAGTQAPSADLAIPLLQEIPPLEVKPLPAAVDPEGVNR